MKLNVIPKSKKCEQDKQQYCNNSFVILLLYIYVGVQFTDVNPEREEVVPVNLNNETASSSQMLVMLSYWSTSTWHCELRVSWFQLPLK